MADNYERAVDFIEKHPDDVNINSEELTQLMLGMTKSDRARWAASQKAKVKSQK